jgi:hypothetical protein
MLHLHDAFIPRALHRSRRLLAGLFDRAAHLRLDRRGDRRRPPRPQCDRPRRVRALPERRRRAHLLSDAGRPSGARGRAETQGRGQVGRGLRELRPGRLCRARHSSLQRAGLWQRGSRRPRAGIDHGAGSAGGVFRPGAAAGHLARLARGAADVAPVEPDRRNRRRFRPGRLRPCRSHCRANTPPPGCARAYRCFTISRPSSTCSSPRSFSGGCSGCWRQSATTIRRTERVSTRWRRRRHPVSSTRSVCSMKLS